MEFQTNTHSINIDRQSQDSKPETEINDKPASTHVQAKTKSSLIPIASANDTIVVLDESMTALGSTREELDDVSRKQAVKNSKIDHLI